MQCAPSSARVLGGDAARVASGCAPAGRTSGFGEAGAGLGIDAIDAISSFAPVSTRRVSPADMPVVLATRMPLAPAVGATESVVLRPCVPMAVMVAISIAAPLSIAMGSSTTKPLTLATLTLLSPAATSANGVVALPAAVPTEATVTVSAEVPVSRVLSAPFTSSRVVPIRGRWNESCHKGPGSGCASRMRRRCGRPGIGAGRPLERAGGSGRRRRPEPAGVWVTG